MCQRIKNRLKNESFALSSPKSWRKEWGTSPYLSQQVLLCYRCVSGLFWLGFIIYDFSKKGTFEIGSRYWTFLSNWVGFVNELYFITACVTILLLLTNIKAEKMPVVGKLAWIFLNILAGTSMLVTVSFWALEYDSKLNLEFRDIVNHGVGSFWILADILLTYNPLYFKHIYQSILFMIVYVLMTIIYDLSLTKSEWYVYSYINWSEDPKEAVIMCFCFLCIAAPFFYFLQALLKPQMPVNESEKDDDFL